jgi:hypothetical protein
MCWRKAAGIEIERSEVVLDERRRRFGASASRACAASSAGRLGSRRSPSASSRARSPRRPARAAASSNMSRSLGLIEPPSARTSLGCTRAGDPGETGPPRRVRSNLTAERFHLTPAKRPRPGGGVTRLGHPPARLPPCRRQSTAAGTPWLCTVGLRAAIGAVTGRLIFASSSVRAEDEPRLAGQLCLFDLGLGREPAKQPSGYGQKDRTDGA